MSIPDTKLTTILVLILCIDPKQFDVYNANMPRNHDQYCNAEINTYEGSSFELGIQISAAPSSPTVHTAGRSTSRLIFESGFITNSSHIATFQDPLTSHLNALGTFYSYFLTYGIV